MIDRQALVLSIGGDHAGHADLVPVTNRMNHRAIGENIGFFRRNLAVGQGPRALGDRQGLEVQTLRVLRIQQRAARLFAN